ncbi:MAG TPA: hypothetical protein VH374_15500 [Polyangia bacterium]|nr:hypothetical protein [Polyangia bacterium]
MSATVGKLTRVVDPWRWPRARDTGDREKALENIGSYEKSSVASTIDHPGANETTVVDAGNEAATVTINTNADYWTRLVGIAWRRDVDIDFDREPIDLDGDGVPDTEITRHIHAPGGVLANPVLFGLTATPDDPAGTVGKISVSTGFLGLRQPLDSIGRPTGQIGMTCFLCHGGVNPADGRVVPGLAAVRFDYGLLLATARLLNDDALADVRYRREHGFPTGRSTRARLLLAGPGRQDLTGEFGLDITVPHLHSAAYDGAWRVRQRPGGVVNPISVPAALFTDGLALQNWSGSEISEGPWLDRLERLLSLATRSSPDGLAAFALGAGDRAGARRALLLDLRNLGTLGLQHDAWPALLWADAIHGRATVDAADLLAIPPMFATTAVRRTLAAEGTALRRPPADPARVARGRVIFVDRVVGVVANRQILKTAPPAYAAAKLDGPLGVAILSPIDQSQPLNATLAVRCADCHNAAPLADRVSLTDHPPPLGRCTHCHRAHPADPSHADRSALVSIARFLPGVPSSAHDEVAACTNCHDQHPDFGPLAYSSSQLLPFDADGDGNAQGDESDDGAAGGIGTEALLAFDVPHAQRPPGGFGVELPVILHPRRAGTVTTVRSGVAWVRVAPLRAVFASAPYLHNGSVPTLRALLEPPRRRPVTFPLGHAGFVFDTRVPGNHNGGHAFGTRLSPAEKDDLVAFLNSL